MKGAKSLYDIIDSERIAGKECNKLRCYGLDLAQAINHMHEKGAVHTDIKPRNVVRTSDGDIKLIDLDASVSVGDVLTQKKKSTAYVSPEVAKVEFQVQESIVDLEQQLVSS